jgi:hypothetical protein
LGQEAFYGRSLEVDDLLSVSAMLSNTAKETFESIETVPHRWVRVKGFPCGGLVAAPPKKRVRVI